MYRKVNPQESEAWTVYTLRLTCYYEHIPAQWRFYLLFYFSPASSAIELMPL